MPDTAAFQAVDAPIEFIDLGAQRRRLGRRVDEAILRVVDHGKYIMGPEVAIFEQELAAFCAHVSVSKICRSSHSPSPTTCRKSLANWMASCLEFARRIANPPTTSLASAKGPSVTVTFPFELRTRAPKAVGRQPSVASSQPAFMPSSTSLPILAISSCDGGAFLSTAL